MKPARNRNGIYTAVPSRQTEYTHRLPLVSASFHKTITDSTIANSAAPVSSEVVAPPFCSPSTCFTKKGSHAITADTAS